MELKIGLARQFSNLGLRSAALDHLTEVIKLEPNSFDAHYLSAEIYRTSNMDEQSITALDECLRIDPTNFDAADIRNQIIQGLDKQ